MNNLEIYICTHKDFQLDPVYNNPTYKIICGEDDVISPKPIPIIRELHNKYSHILYALSELSRFYYVWKNIELPEYIGFCHYRRFFSRIPDLDLLDDDTVFTLEEMKFQVESLYDICHILDDFLLMKDILINKFNIPKEKLESTFDGLYPCNIFIMNRKNFNKYCEFMFAVLDEMIDALNFKDMNDIEKHIMKYAKGRARPMYLKRIFAFLLERLSSIYHKLNFKNIITIPVKNKY